MMMHGLTNFQFTHVDMRWSNITWGFAKDFSVYTTAVGDGFFFFLPFKSENHQNGLKIHFVHNSNTKTI
jgi:hypothetical protein